MRLFGETLSLHHFCQSNNPGANCSRIFVTTENYCCDGVGYRRNISGEFYSKRQRGGYGLVHGGPPGTDWWAPTKTKDFAPLLFLNCVPADKLSFTRPYPKKAACLHNHLWLYSIFILIEKMESKRSLRNILQTLKGSKIFFILQKNVQSGYPGQESSYPLDDHFKPRT